MQQSNRSLMWHGMFLFVLGLLTGFAETNFANMRMGLAAHLEGVMNGTFLIALGAVWNEVHLPPLAALSPITAAGRHGLAWQEALVTAGFMSVGVILLVSCALMLWGLRSRALPSHGALPA